MLKKFFNILITVIVLVSLTACGEANATQDTISGTTDITEKLFMVNGKLYYGTDEVGPMGDSDCVEGHILSSVDSSETPSQDAQSNFGCVGNPYTDDSDGWIMILMDDEEYHIFYEKSDVGVSTDYPASIMVDDKIYFLESEPISEEIDESEILGYTSSYTDAMPSKNGETNFNRELEMPYAVDNSTKKHLSHLYTIQNTL